MLAPKKEPAAQEAEESEERKDDAFTCEQLLSMWSKYASQAKDDKRIGLYTAMCSADVSLEENHTIGITVSSTVIAREIEDEILDILRFLKWQNCCGRSVRFVAVHRVPWSDNDSFCIIT